jgi:hypothetical protein
MTTEEKNAWEAWSKVILYRLDQQHEDIQKVEKSLGETRKEVEQAKLDITGEIIRLKMRSGIWGAMAGLIPGVAALIWVALRG